MTHPGNLSPSGCGSLCVRQTAKQGVRSMQRSGPRSLASAHSAQPERESGGQASALQPRVSGATNLRVRGAERWLHLVRVKGVGPLNFAQHPERRGVELQAERLVGHGPEHAAHLVRVDKVVVVAAHHVPDPAVVSRRDRLQEEHRRRHLALCNAVVVEPALQHPSREAQLPVLLKVEALQLAKRVENPHKLLAAQLELAEGGQDEGAAGEVGGQVAVDLNTRALNYLVAG